MSKQSASSSNCPPSLQFIHYQVYEDTSDPVESTTIAPTASTLLTPSVTSTTTITTSSIPTTTSSKPLSSTAGALSTTLKKRQRIACDNCRQRKSKCDGSLPCSYCKEKGSSCQYAEPTRRGPISKKECNSGISFSVFTEYKMMQTLETKQYIQLYMEHVNPLFPVCIEARLMNPQSTAQKAQTYVALAFVAQVYCDTTQSKMFISNAKQLASSFFDEPSFDSAVAMTMMGQYWYNLTSDQVNASTYSTLGYSLSKYLPQHPLNDLVKNFSYLHHIALDPALSPNQSSGTMYNHIPTMKTQNWAASDIFGDFMMIVSGVIKYLGINLSITSTFANLSRGSFTEPQRIELMSGINQLDYKLYKSPKLPVGTHVFHTITNRMTRSYVEWKSGHLDAAAEAAIQVLHLFLTLRAAKKLYVMLVDRPYITVEFLGLNICALNEAGAYKEADQLLNFVREYFSAVVASSKIELQIGIYLAHAPQREQTDPHNSFPSPHEGSTTYELNSSPSAPPPVYPQQSVPQPLYPQQSAPPPFYPPQSPPSPPPNTNPLYNTSFHAAPPIHPLLQPHHTCYPPPQPQSLHQYYENRDKW